VSSLASELTLAPGDRSSAESLSNLIELRASRSGTQTYVEHARRERRLSFGDLADDVERWSRFFERSRVGVGSTVGLVISDPIDFTVAFLASIATGRWAAPLDPSTPVHGAGGMTAAIARVEADIVLADRSLPGGLDVDWVDLGTAVSLDGAVTAGSTVREPRRSESGGAILASSGTTGVPKVVPLPQHQLLHTARSVAVHHTLSSNDRGFNPLPLFHINAEVVGLLSALVAGSSLVLDDRFHRTHFWQLMAEREITWINAVPAIISRLADPGPDEIVPPRIRFIRSASAPLPAATAARFEANTGIPVVETYGMTEAASQITANPVSGMRKPGSVGLPVGVELRVVAGPSPADEASGRVDGHGVGHVEIRGPSVITTYGGGHHADRIDVDGWLRTGDLGHLDQDGYLYLDSRVDDVINRGGEKVFPREIEEMILLDPDVTAVAVVGAPDPELGQVPVAFLVLQDGAKAAGAEATLARVRKHLQSALVRSKRPVTLNVVSELAAGPTGKVRRRDLSESALTVTYRLDCR
jgi:oxalate---CoA ligase